MTAEPFTMQQANSKSRRRIVRPKIHITSPFGWLNDPCAPGYDSNTGLYHLFYQCNPYGVDWGNMSWGHATSKDLVTWRYARVHTPLQPGKKYDREGVFTGCLGPITHKNELSIFYTSIARLPFHWTNPAERGSAGLALATSADDGLTWAKSKSNPILTEEPEGLDVTGFRDPYLAEWPALDLIRDKKSLYGLISGGIQGKGPTSFVYAVDPQYIKQWEYLGPLVDIPLRWQPSQKWDSNYGVNWECVNFMTLQAGLVSRQLLILGSEGDVAREHLHGRNLPPNIPPRTVRSQQWMAGDLTKIEDGFRMQYKYGGILDHGPYYAANSFADPVSGRRVVYGWIPEEDCTQDHAHLKGWNGCQAFPRELFLQSMSNVTGALHSSLDEISCIERVRQPDGSLTLYTMGIRPIAELEQLCSTSSNTQKFVAIAISPGKSRRLTETQLPTWCARTQITLEPSKCSKVGFHIRHAADMSTRTTITFSLDQESITVERAHSAPQHPDFNCCDETGPFTLFMTQSANEPHEILEKLDLHIISDGDVLEVFANERFALATMVYTGGYDVCNGISIFAEGESGGAVVDEMTIWDGLNGEKSCIVYEADEEDD